MKRFAAVFLLLATVGCGEETILQNPMAPDPIVLSAPLVSGGWQGVVTSSTLPNAVWTMSLTQEAGSVAGTYADDVNGLDGTVSATITADGRVIGSLTMNMRAAPGAIPFCTAAATMRGTVGLGASQMGWSSPGFPTCAGAPIQLQMNWSRTQ